jgi:hypothetical protein
MHMYAPPAGGHRARCPLPPSSANHPLTGACRLNRSRYCSRGWSTINAGGRLPFLPDHGGVPEAPLQTPGASEQARLRGIRREPWGVTAVDARELGHRRAKIIRPVRSRIAVGLRGVRAGRLTGWGALVGRETLGTEGDEQRRVRQENVEQFVQEQKELLSNLRLESTGARERPEKKARRLQVSVPVGLGPGNVFNVNVDGTEYPVTVPAGTYGGHALQLILEDGGDNRKDDWNAQLQAAARMDISLESALAVAESMLDFFHVPEAQVLACRAVQHILDKSKEGASNETEVERLGLEVRSHFARVNMVIRSHSARVNMVVRSHFARVNRFAHTLRVSTWWRFYSLASDTTSMAAWWTSQRLDHRL